MSNYDYYTDPYLCGNYKCKTYVNNGLLTVGHALTEFQNNPTILSLV